MLDWLLCIEKSGVEIMRMYCKVFRRYAFAVPELEQMQVRYANVILSNKHLYLIVYGNVCQVRRSFLVWY